MEVLQPVSNMCLGVNLKPLKGLSTIHSGKYPKSTRSAFLLFLHRHRQP